MLKFFVLISAFLFSWGFSQENKNLFSEFSSIILQKYSNPYQKNLKSIFAKAQERLNLGCPNMAVCPSETVEGVIGEVLAELDDSHISVQGFTTLLDRLPAPYRFSSAHTLTSYAQGGYTVINLPEWPMYEYANDFVFKAITQAKKRGSKGIVLDLRGNSGGSVYTALILLGAFVNTGYFFDYVRDDIRYKFTTAGRILTLERSTGVVETQDLIGENKLQFDHWDGPLSVLVSQNTASSGETMAYLLQHSNRAKVFGEPTRGGLCGLNYEAQSGYVIFPDNRALFFPDGRCWNLDGSIPPNRVTPDVIVPFYQRVFDRGRDLTMESAIYWLKQQQK
jgi:C-terminal processing protease CtpA/Prc